MSFRGFAKWGLPLLVVGLVFGVLAWFQPVKVAHIQGQSMQPTLYSGDFALFVKTGAVSKGDVVLFEPPAGWGKRKGALLVKRVVAVPGDRVKVSKDALLVNGKLVLDFKSVLGFSSGRIDEFVVKDSFFVLGDNHKHSYDSLMRFLTSDGEDFLVPAGSVGYRAVWLR